MKSANNSLMINSKLILLLSVIAFAFGLGITEPKSVQASVFESDLSITGNATATGDVTFEVRTKAGVLVTGITFTVTMGDTPTTTASAASALPLMGDVSGVTSSGGNLTILSTTNDFDCLCCNGPGPCVPPADIIPPPATFLGQTWDKTAGIETPTVSEWGLVVMTLLCMAAGTIMYGRWRRVQAVA